MTNYSESYYNMSKPYKHESGASKRKKKAEKEERILKLPKLDTYFKFAQSPEGPSGSKDIVGEPSNSGGK